MRSDFEEHQNLWELLYVKIQEKEVEAILGLVRVQGRVVAAAWAELTGEDSYGVQIVSLQH